MIVCGYIGRIGLIGSMCLKLITTSEEPEIALSCICAVPSSIEQEIFSVKLYDIPHMIDSGDISKNNVGFNRSLIQHAHKQERIALTYRFFVNQCSVSGKAMLGSIIIGYVFTNVSVDSKNLFNITLTGKIQLVDHFVQLCLKGLLFGIRGIIFNGISQGVIIGIILGILACGCRIALNSKMHIGIKLIGSLMEPSRNILIGNKSLRRIVEG